MDDMDSARRRVTVFDIARAAHVSIATVDRALKGRDGISPATAARVLSVAAELGWQPNMAAQGLSRRVPLDIRVLLPDDDNPFIRQLQRIVGDLRD
ncbi:MAG: LacI family DNA-binding transcriptional regulator [Rhizobiales bacterium]|nr:LacI family DNA-binding transcriptional regulator [Hyphomicrobiales bacterium]